MSSVAPDIDQAVIPAAGLGTRLRPLTRAIPKEMLPLGRKPVLEYVIEEMRCAGIRKLLFILSPGKEMIRSYFGDGRIWDVRCDYVIQPEMAGLGDAILRAEEWVEGQPFVVAFGDCIIEARGKRPEARGERTEARGERRQDHDSLPIVRLVETHLAQRADATVLTERIPRDLTGRYGILMPAADIPRRPTEPFQFTHIVEKPAPENAPSFMAVAARWALNPGVFRYLRNTAPAPNGEVNLTDSIQRWLADGAVGWAVPLHHGEARRDIGGWDTYLVAAARAAASDAEFGRHVRQLLNGDTPDGEYRG